MDDTISDAMQGGQHQYLEFQQMMPQASATSKSQRPAAAAKSGTSVACGGAGHDL